MAKHYPKNKNPKRILVLLLFFIVFFVFLVLPQITLKNKLPEEKTEYQISKSDIHPIYNITFLQSHSFTLTVQDGITTINATISNNSAESINDLKCVYSLIDCYNNLVYSFDISINNIEANNSSSFACMAMLDLSNVVDYSVSLFEQ